MGNEWGMARNEGRPRSVIRAFTCGDIRSGESTECSDSRNLEGDSNKGVGAVHRLLPHVMLRPRHEVFLPMSRPENGPVARFLVYPAGYSTVRTAEIGEGNSQRIRILRRPCRTLRIPGEVTSFDGRGVLNSVPTPLAHTLLDPLTRIFEQSPIQPVPKRPRRTWSVVSQSIRSRFGSQGLLEGCDPGRPDSPRKVSVRRDQLRSMVGARVNVQFRRNPCLHQASRETDAFVTEHVNFANVDERWR
jgi:hypothetical protein